MENICSYSLYYMWTISESSNNFWVCLLFFIEKWKKYFSRILDTANFSIGNNSNGIVCAEAEAQWDFHGTLIQICECFSFYFPAIKFPYSWKIFSLHFRVARSSLAYVKLHISPRNAGELFQLENYIQQVGICDFAASSQSV